MKTITIKLTPGQVELITFALSASAQMHGEFLMHDDWYEDMDRKQVAKTKQAHRAMLRAYSIFMAKCLRAAAK